MPCSTPTRPGRDGGGVPAGVDPVAAGLEPVQRDPGVGDEVGEDAERVRAAAHAGRHRVRQPAVPVQHLRPGLGADHPLELADQHRERVRAGDRADQVVGVVDPGDPVAHRVVHRVLERLGAGLDGDHLGAEQPHPGHVERLPLGVDLAHVDRALEAEQGGRRRRGHPVLAGAGLGDHPGLAHPAGQQGLAEHVVDLVRAGVVEVLALEHDAWRRPACSAKRRASVIGTGPAGVVGQQAGQLGGERRIRDAAAWNSCSSWARAAYSASGTNLPPNWSKWPLGVGQLAPTEPAGSSRWGVLDSCDFRLPTGLHVAEQERRTGASAPGRRTRTCAPPGGPRRRPGRPPRCGVAPGHQRLADQHHVGAGPGQARSRRAVRARRTRRSGRCRRGSAARAGRRWSGSTSRVLQVAGVDADDPGPGVHRAANLVGGVRLDQRGQPDRAGPARSAQTSSGRSAPRRSAAPGRPRPRGPRTAGRR